MNRLAWRAAAPAVSVTPWLYLAAVALAQALWSLGRPLPALCLSALLAVALIGHSSWTDREDQSRLFLTISVLPLLQIVSLGISPQFVSGIWYAVAIEGAALGAALSALRALQLPLAALGWQRPRSLILSAAVVVSGLVSGWIGQQILHPALLVTGTRLQDILPAAALLILFTGLAEEAVFRGLIQYTASRWLGGVAALLYTAVAWALLQPVWKSPPDVLFVLLVGLVWGGVRWWNRSTLDLGLAHGITNVLLLVALPGLH